MGDGYLDLILVAIFAAGVIVAGFWVLVESKSTGPVGKPETPSAKDLEYRDVVERVRGMLPNRDVWGAAFADGAGYGIYAYNGTKTACFHVRSAITVNGKPIIWDVTKDPKADELIAAGVGALRNALKEIGDE